jgi:hypothetical protein
MFILHVNHYYFQVILKISFLAKKMQIESVFLLTARTFTSGKLYKIFEVPVLVFARASGNAVSAAKPWDRGCISMEF